MLFSVETQTTEERTQQYQSEVESIYKDLTAKGKALMLSTELGVRSSSDVLVSPVSPYLESFSSLGAPASPHPESAGDPPPSSFSHHCT